MPNLPDTFAVYAPKLLDQRQVAANGLPYPDKTAALLALPLARRAQGLTVLIGTATVFKEYWWLAGTADDDLVLKLAGGSPVSPPLSKEAIEAFATAGVEDGSSVTVQCLYAGSPQSGGIFVLDLASTIEVNDGTVLATDTTGRWLRQFSGSLDVRWFGAMPGTFPDQAPMIQKALDVGKYDNGSSYFAGNTVYIPRGQWYINQPLKLYRGSVLEGDGDWDQEGSELMMMDNSNCPAIQTPYAHSGGSGNYTQYLRVYGIRINGRSANQTADATSIEWHGTYVGSFLDYIFISDWRGPAITTFEAADTHISRIWVLGCYTDSYAIQFSRVSQTGQIGFMLLDDIYCEHVLKSDRVTRGNGFLFNKLISVHAKGLHTEYLACPITLRACQNVSIDGGSGYGDGWATPPVYDEDGNITVPGIVSPEGALIYVDDATSFYNLHIGPYSAPAKAIGVQVFNSAPGVGFGVFPNTAGTEPSGGLSWGGIDTTNNLVNEGNSGLSYGQITSGYGVIAGNPQSTHPGLIFKPHPYLGGNLFFQQFRVDYDGFFFFSEIAGDTQPGGGNQRNYFQYGRYGPSGGFAVAINQQLAFQHEITPTDPWCVGRVDNELYWRDAAGVRKISMEGDVITVSSGGTGATAAPAARLNLDVAAAPILLVEEDSEVVLMADNTMSSKVIEAYYDVEVFVSLLDINTIKPGDVWEVCQIGPGRLLVSTGTSILGQLVTLQFPPGGGRRTAGQYSTLFIRCRAKTSTTATLLVTGGVP